MRLDYYHSGNRGRVLQPRRGRAGTAAVQRQHEPPIDTTLRGKYLFEIVDSATGAVAWSRSFSSIYGEWETTGEAQGDQPHVQRVLRFPAQDKDSTWC